MVKSKLGELIIYVLFLRNEYTNIGNTDLN